MRNYIGNNNEINKKKYKKSLPPKLNPDAGNVEHNIDVFNKASSGDANLSSAAGMNGMAESYDRDSLIARITEFGKHYNFDKYTDAQLNAMLNRLVDAENYRKRVLPKRQDKINIQSDRHIMNDDPSYNFDDPEREGEYRVENLREALNRLDHYCIDNDKTFYDLRSLYEGIKYQLKPEEKQELKRLVDTTNDPDAIKAYIDSKDPNRKRLLQSKGIMEEDIDDEELDEDLNFNSPFPTWNDAYDLFQEVVDKYFPDEDKINMEIENLRLKYEGNKEFDYAYELWINSGEDDIEDDIEDEEEEDQLITATWADETDVDFDESLNEGVLDTLKAKRQARLDKIDAKKRAEDPLYDAMRRYSLGESSKFNTIIYRKKKKSVDESMKDMDSLLLLQSLLNQYPDISIEDEDYLNSLSYSDLVKEIKNRGWEDVLNEDLSEEDFEGEIFDIFDILADAAIAAGGDSDDTSGNIESSDYLMDRLTCSFTSTTEISNKNFIEKIKKSIKQALENQTRFKNDIDIYVALNRYSDLPADLTKKYKNYIIEIEAYADDNDPLSRANWSDETDVDFDESLNEDTVKQGNKWVNKGKEGTHGKFKTKKAADAQRKAMFANGYKGESLKLKESSPVNYKKKISLIREIDRGIPYSMRYKEADIVNDYDNDELILYWVTEDPFTKDELQEFAFHATECCHDMYDDIVQIALTYRGISRGFNSDDNLNKLIWIDAAGEWTDEDWDNYVEKLKKVGVDVQANDLIAADWEDSIDFDFNESLKLKKKRR